MATFHSTHALALILIFVTSIRTHSVKFCEVVVMVLSSKTLETSASKEEDVSLEIVPDSEHFLNRTALEEDGQKTFKHLLDFLGSQSITRYSVVWFLVDMVFTGVSNHMLMSLMVHNWVWFMLSSHDVLIWWCIGKLSCS